MCDAGIERADYLRLRQAYLTLLRFVREDAALDGDARRAFTALALPDASAFPDAPAAPAAVLAVRTRAPKAG